MTLVFVAALFTLMGTFGIEGDLVIHWSEEEVPNDFAGKWILWAMLLLAFISMFTYSSLRKNRNGNDLLSVEMACAFSSGLVFTWTIADVILVIYNLYPLAVIPEIGMIAIVCCYILFFMTAYIQKKRNNRS